MVMAMVLPMPMAMMMLNDASDGGETVTKKNATGGPVCSIWCFGLCQLHHLVME